MGAVVMTKQALKRLATFSSELDASAIVNLLEEHGVKALAVGGFTAGFKAEAPGFVDVMVLEGDLDAASGVLGEVGPAHPLARLVDEQAIGAAGADNTDGSHTQRRQNVVSLLIAAFMLLCLLTLVIGWWMK